LHTWTLAFLDGNMSALSCLIHPLTLYRRGHLTMFSHEE
jgi:hypothetical protein